MTTTSNNNNAAIYDRVLLNLQQLKLNRMGVILDGFLERAQKEKLSIV